MMEKTVTERACQKVLRWRVPQGRTPCRTDHCGQSHAGDRHAGESHEGGYHPGEILLESSKAPAGDSRDGEDQLGELHTALIIVGEAHDGQDYAKASYHGQGRDGEPLPESLTIMETTRSESPTRENAMPERLFQRVS